MLTFLSPATASTMLSQSLSPTVSDATPARSSPANSQPRTAISVPRSHGGEERTRSLAAAANADRRDFRAPLAPVPRKPAVVSDEGDSEQGGGRSSARSDGPSRAEVASATQAAGVWRGTTATKVCYYDGCNTQDQADSYVIYLYLDVWPASKKTCMIFAHPFADASNYIRLLLSRQASGWIWS